MQHILVDPLTTLSIVTVVVTPLDQNCRILVSGSDALVVDPGGDYPRIAKKLEQLGVVCRQIWLTHSHLDHCGAVGELRQASGATVYGHPHEALMRERVEEISEMYGIPAGIMRRCPEPDKMLRGGETVTFAGYEFSVLFTPGHSPGHLAFYCAALKVILSGDTLFAGSIGNTQLPGAHHATLMRSLREVITVLPGDTRVLAGHGPDTTIAAELADNPFLRE